jgi:acylphosphatase
MNKSLQIRIRGEVQGVGFRQWTVQQARLLDIRGYVRNLPEGSVEVLAIGDPQVLNQFCEILRQGPMLAQVDTLDTKEVQEPPYIDAFRILYG